MNKKNLKSALRQTHLIEIDDNLHSLLCLKEVLEEELNDGTVPLSPKAEGYIECKQEIVRRISNVLKLAGYNE